MADARIVVINPNSTVAVTAGIDRALQPLRLPGGPAIDCVTLSAGPPAIESQRDADNVIAPLCEYIDSRRDDAIGAYVIACYSDPGLHSAREISPCPVFGMAECGILTALSRGERFGVISILQRSIPRHLRSIRTMGVASRLAADLAIELGVLELASEHKVLQRMSRVGARLRDEYNADVIVMGCAGMAGYRQPLEDKLGIPVIEPTRAAVAIALGTVRPEG